MNVFPQHSAHAATTSRGTFFNEPSSLVHMRYGSAGGNEEVGKDQQMNPTLYQVLSYLLLIIITYFAPLKWYSVIVRHVLITLKTTSLLFIHVLIEV